LTASLGIGNYVTRQLATILGAPGVAAEKEIVTTKMPSVQHMVEEFHRTDGYVTLNGFAYKVTHPLTRLGWTHQSGLAASDGPVKKSPSVRSKL